MEWPLCGKHLFHQSRLRSRENVSDLSLLLRFVPYCVFNGTPIKLGNLLKFVKANSHAKAGIMAQLTRQRKNLGSKRFRIRSAPLNDKLMSPVVRSTFASGLTR